MYGRGVIGSSAMVMNLSLSARSTRGSLAPFPSSACDGSES